MLGAFDQIEFNLVLSKHLFQFGGELDGVLYGYDRVLHPVLQQERRRTGSDICWGWRLSLFLEPP